MLDFQKLIAVLTYQPDAPMIFNTGLFLFLFLVVLCGHSVLYKTHTPKILFLTLFSFFFYYKSSGMYFLLLVLSTVVDFHLGNLIYKATRKSLKKQLMVLSIVLNLGVLAYFKYTNFLMESMAAVFSSPLHHWDIFLPVGISFYTFQSLSYTIDIYREEIKPIPRILDYAFFVSFFPQLVAGPIVRAKDFIPQIYRPTIVTTEMVGRGVFLILTGLFKKAVISDYISTNFVDRIFENPTLYTGLENLVGIYGYALQIYCDFSGYSDMAIGIALLLGYEFIINFDSPYQSSSITEFWRRWHISLSSWLRDYLYISMGGNRKGKARTYLHLIVTMLLGGLWHGAAIRFVIWGAMHGLALAADKAIKSLLSPKEVQVEAEVHTLEEAAKRQRKRKKKQHLPLIQPVFNSTHEDKPKWSQWIGVFFTFHFVCFCWIVFRAEDMHTASQILSQIAFEFHPEVWMSFVLGYTDILLLMIVGYFLHFIPYETTQKFQTWVSNTPFFAKVLMLTGMIILVIQFKSAEIHPFIYFQF